jgi:2-oxoglutarate dehydrogenase E1 component
MDVEPGSINLAFIEELYAAYLVEPSSVPPDWRAYFKRIGNGQHQLGPTFSPSSLFNPRGPNGAAGRVDVHQYAELAAMQHRVDQLVRNYRVRGHRVARLDPLKLPRPDWPELNPAFFGLKETDMDRPFSSELVPGADSLTLRKIVERMRNTYCRYIGVQFMHIDNLWVREWLQERMEGSENRLQLSGDEQVRILTWLTDAIIFEEFIQQKFISAKRFSLEGAESLIPLLQFTVEKAAANGVDEVIFGMAHRGRLNVLANVVGKNPRQIFREFEDIDPELHLGRGDVKYHLGHFSEKRTALGDVVHLALAFNPSHLEYVNPVVLGRVRAKQDRTHDTNRERSMGLIIHGDAAFAAEGIVQETLTLSELAGYTTGGTIHVIVNNQIGFTTSPTEARSGVYCTDVAKMLQIPIFHVNGEDPEAVAQVVSLAVDFRRAFKQDVVIDMYCYRRRGHNEGDEPAFTQPLMYKAIRDRKSVRESYLKRLLKLGGITQEQADRIAQESQAKLEEALKSARSEDHLHPSTRLGGMWSAYRGGPDKRVPEPPTGVDKARLKRLLEKLSRVPESFTPHPKIVRFLEQRRQMATEEKPIDWSTAEALAFATLSTDGIRVRLTGQDSERGTFSQRHTVLHDYESGERYTPIKHLSDDQGAIDVFNSPLNESGVLGFEYGYSVGYPDGLVLWEAQFGDFSNVAQVIIDQFITSAEDKWRRLSGIVLLLPHGFEGMGPEHSSARLERFLQLAAEDNIQVVIPSTPAQYFHVLRRQVERPWRKPLVVMTPKSLLRHPQCVSSLEELSTGRFYRLLPDSQGLIEGAERILVCSGKIFYELEAERERLGRTDVAIVRVEQLYPLQPKYIEKVLAPYAADIPVVWVQEEPENMGAWRRMRGKYGRRWFDKHPLAGVYREASASPATGSASSHKIEQQQLLDHAFGELAPLLKRSK